MSRLMRRRSQDAEAAQGGVALAADDDVVVHGYAELLGGGRHLLGHGDVVGRRRRVAGRVVMEQTAQSNRSEEHTSELQSLTNLVCRLLLEKKKTYITTTPAPL